jgi:hypothetical protein
MNMKKIFNRSLIWILIIPVFMIACKEEDPTLGAVPTAADVEFTFVPTPVSDNIIKLTNTSPGFSRNGISVTGKLQKEVKYK